MIDFCKLYCIDGIGQVLASIEDNDKGQASLRFRIPDHDGIGFSMSLCLGSEDEDENEAFAHRCLGELNEETALKAIRPLLDAKRRLMS
ncbi:hypothetical protein PARHAE_01099 [Paracoccus haematequi]|uniref:Uncharacterized protein n=1 Tax=Paracoccus haematequi TaxID=2491866 RepID=A0A447IKC6_9RHOB|nr:hypothetical protein [Paracoccus haematequi]VDS07919.1 hypothetical protein PARHAE_01099 [Paracoccus haematequi]